MYKIYLKQAFQILRQNKLISIVSIAGTALAIMMIMVILIAHEIKTANLAPEINRTRTAYIRYQLQTSKNEQSRNRNPIFYDSYKNHLSHLKTPELTAIANLSPVRLVQQEEEKEQISARVVGCDANFWKLFSFSFLEGAPFSQTDYDDGIPNAIVTESMAQKLYDKETPLGKSLLIEQMEYRIGGVVRDISPIFKYASGDIWIPFSAAEDYENGGGLTVFFLLKNKNALAALSSEIREEEQKYAAANDAWNIRFVGPYDHAMETAAEASKHREEPNLAANRWRTALIILALFLVPAFNLSSFSMSQIKKRTEEIGIRKAFGGRKSAILLQVLCENLLSSLMGGLLGLALSCAAVISLKEWLFRTPSDAAIPLEAFISPAVFLYVFLACVILNLLSAAIPAYKAATMNIVESLNRNKL